VIVHAVCVVDVDTYIVSVFGYVDVADVYVVVVCVCSCYRCCMRWC